MADVKWIKLATQIFDNRKIKQIECMPAGDSIIVVWFKLLCLAGTVNNNGILSITEEIPYTEKMLIAEFHMEDKASTLSLALRTFEQFGMIEIIDNIFYISSWEKYQNVEGLEKIREQTRNRVSKHRENQKALSCNVTCNDDVTHGNATEEEIDKEIDKDIERNIKTDYQQIADMYNEICISFPRLTKLSNARKKAIGARLKEYGIDDFRNMFQLAESSNFLKGKNDRDWSATFDWLLKDSNMAKVLDGNYNNKGKGVDNATRGIPSESDKSFAERAIEKGYKPTEHGPMPFM